MGIGYVIDHYISYFHKEQEQKCYETYITDALRIISENTAKANGGSYFKIRYADIITPQKQETRTAEEVIDNIRDKLKRL